MIILQSGYTPNEYADMAVIANATGKTLTILKDGSVDMSDVVQTLEDVKKNRLSIIKAKLLATDYKQAKYIDGDLTETEYAPIKAERVNLRSAYNAIEVAATIEEVQNLGE